MASNVYLKVDYVSTIHNIN